MVEFLQSRFSETAQPIYIFNKLKENDLLEKRELSLLKDFKTSGSSLFQVIVLTPNQQTIKAANRLSLWDLQARLWKLCNN